MARGEDFLASGLLHMEKNIGILKTQLCYDMIPKK